MDSRSVTTGFFSAGAGHREPGLGVALSGEHAAVGCGAASRFGRGERTAGEAPGGSRGAVPGGREKSAVVSASVGTRSVLRASVKGSLGESSGQGDITCGVFHPNKGETCQSRLPATDRRAAAVVGPTEPRGLPRFCATGDGLLPPEVVLSKRLPPTGHQPALTLQERRFGRPFWALV